MDIRYLGTSKRYSEAVVANGLVFLSGMVPENPEADAKAQTENV
ncbi:RidA family protein, partial [Neisseria sp. P0009.S007]